jgi:hypothetical protein
MILPRVVLDVNICVRALITRGSAAEIVHNQATRYTLYLSQTLLGKIDEVARRPHLFHKYNLHPDEIDAYIRRLQNIGVVIPVTTKLDVLSDPEDNRILACAVDARADYLVTGDPHFDSLDGQYGKIRILDSVAFLNIIRLSPNWVFSQFDVSCSKRIPIV